LVLVAEMVQILLAHHLMLVEVPLAVMQKELLLLQQVKFYMHMGVKVVMKVVVPMTLLVLLWEVKVLILLPHQVINLVVEEAQLQV
jgi:hypothetical protein